MKHFLIIFLFIPFLGACTSNEKVTPIEQPKASNTLLKKEAKGCLCHKMWLPVCGSDNKTYGNSCEADCAQVKYTMGECLKKL